MSPSPFHLPGRPEVRDGGASATFLPALAVLDESVGLLSRRARIGGMVTLAPNGSPRMPRIEWRLPLASTERRERRQGCYEHPSRLTKTQVLLGDLHHGSRHSTSLRFLWASQP